MVNQERLVELFCDLVKIKSPSGQEEEIISFIVKRLEKVGLKFHLDNYGNIIVKINGYGNPLILCAHLDTVAVSQSAEIRPIVKNGIIQSDKNTILGADNKNFVSAILELLTIILELNLKCRSLEIVFTKEEEAISKGAKNLDLSLLKGRECLIADDSSPLGEITLSAPFNEKFEVCVYGKEAHVKNSDQAISAIEAASLIVCGMPLGMVSEFTTINIAYLVAGLKGVVEEINFKDLTKQLRNTVPNFACLLGELRSPKIEEFKKSIILVKQICQKIESETRANITFDSERLSDGYFHDKNDPFIKKIIKTFRQKRIQPSFKNSIGGSDANVLNSRGIKSVVISSGEKNAHTTEEQMAISDLVNLADFLVAFTTKNN